MKNTRKETVQSSRKVRPFVLETKNQLADLVEMEPVDLDLEETDLVEMDPVAIEEMERAEMETNWRGSMDAI